MSSSTTPSSDLYKTLSHTATAFLQACRPSPLGSNISDSAAILSLLAPDFQVAYGHKLFVSLTPMLQGVRSGPEFAERTAAAGLYAVTWDIEITDMIVDEVKRSVVVRGDFSTTVVAGKTVLNDLIIVMKMDESGEKLRECIEFPDPSATAEMMRIWSGGE